MGRRADLDGSQIQRILLDILCGDLSSVAAIIHSLGKSVALHMSSAAGFRLVPLNDSSRSALVHLVDHQEWPFDRWADVDCHGVSEEPFGWIEQADDLAMLTLVEEVGVGLESIALVVRILDQAHSR